MKKGKVLTTISMLVMTIACLTFGVFAIISTSFTATGTITFNAYELDILVHGQIIGAVDNGSLATEYKRATKNTHGVAGYETSSNGTLPEWDMGGLAFDELNENNLITIKFIITNYSKYAIEATATITNQSALETNLTITNTPIAYCYASENDGAIIDSRELVLTFAPKTNSAAFVKDLSITLNIIPSSKTPTTTGFTTSVSGDEVTITKYSGTATEVIIPRTIGGGTVTSIGNNAFNACSKLTSITIPSSVTSIGNYAFNACSKLTSITIPSSVISIGNNAFCNCSSLISITIPDSVTSIGYSAFYGCSKLISVTIANGLTSLENRIFLDCSSLTSITIPSSVTSIVADAFLRCSSLTSITIPSSVTSIGSSAFSGCSSLSSIIVDSGNTVYDSRDNCNAIIDKSSAEGPTLISGCKNTIIPDSVTGIGADAFRGHTALSSITIPSSVTSIGADAFHSCSGLTSITIPSSVTSVGNNVFDECTNLTAVTILGNIISISNAMFGGCEHLTSITIPNSVTSIGDSAFAGCSSLTSITIPSSVDHIDSLAFGKGCGLTSAKFENATGWQVSSDNTTWNNITGTLPSTEMCVSNATLLTDTYMQYYWRRG